MPHPIYGDPSHELEAVSLHIWLPSRRLDLPTRVMAAGRANTSRTALWTIEQTWATGEDAHGYNVGDFCSHVAMVCLQDHPTSQQQVDACMVGEGWAQDPLF